MSLRAISSALWRVARATVVPADEHRLEVRHRGEFAGAPDLDIDVQEPRGGAFGRELVRDRPPRELRGRAEFALQGQRVDLDHHAIDVVVEGVAQRLEFGTARQGFVDRGAGPDLRVGPEAEVAQEGQGRGVGLRLRSRDPRDRIEEQLEAALGHLTRVELLHRPRGGVPRIDEGLFAVSRPLVVEAGEDRPGQVDLAADLEEFGNREPVRGPRRESGAASGWCGRFPVTSSPIFPSPRVTARTRTPFSYVTESDRPSILGSATYERGVSPSCRRTRTSNSRTSSSLYVFSRLNIGSLWVTDGNSERGAPPTRWVGESGVMSSGCAASRSLSSRSSASNSWSVISGVERT